MYIEVEFSSDLRLLIPFPLSTGKTTFLEDTTKSHKCTYIRQYHNIRPYVTVSKIPNFDPTKLPYWDIYVKEGKADSIKVGGTMAGEFTAGLSGGQRKLLLFELICQRTASQSDLLLVLDEPFAGVTDDFVPWIVGRLNEMRTNHNILLVTNDHVETLKGMADNTIVVSAIDRSKVQVNGLNSVDREKCILALSVGEDFSYKGTSKNDLKFFYDVEIANNGGLIGIAAFTVVVFSLFLATFWNSKPNQAALIYVASSMVAYFALNPYLLTLTDWRNYMTEEAEALVHASKDANKMLKSMLVLTLFLVVSLIEWGCANGVVDGSFEGGKIFIGMVLDALSLISPFLFFGLYTKLPFEAVEIFSLLPFLFMIFFSTTFSPGSGVEGLKELRYLFVRFYLFCVIPGVQDEMEGCPDSDLSVLYMVLSGFIFAVIFAVYKITQHLFKSMMKKKAFHKKNKLKDAEFRDLQVELYGENILLRDSLSSTNHSATTPKSVGTSSHQSSMTSPKNLEIAYSESEDFA